MKFIADLCRTLWQILLGVISTSFVYAYFTDTLIESDFEFSLYFLSVISLFVLIDLILRYLWKKKSK